MKRLLSAAAVCVAMVAIFAVLVLSPSLRHQASHLPGLAWLDLDSDAHANKHSHDERPAVARGEPEKKLVKLDKEQIEAAEITTAEARPAVITRRRSVPGVVAVSGDRVARVAVKLLGTVAELRKRLGEPVQKGEVVAVIESREVADAKSDYLAAKLQTELQDILSARAQKLTETSAISENEYLRIKATTDNAKVRFESARQKLYALGLTPPQIEQLPREAPDALRLQELRSPIAGRVAERRVDVGALVGREGQESELFVIADLDEVWVELAVSPNDLGSVEEGQKIGLFAAGLSPLQAQIIFISPLLDRETRAARVVALLANPSHRLRPGAFVTAELILERKEVAVAVPKTALQVINEGPAVFIRTTDGFEARSVITGLEDKEWIEITAGLSAGELVAITNTFVLKAELGKGEAEHGH